MKRIIFSLMLLLCVGSVFGQNADELIKRWKAHSSMSYEDVTDKVKKDCKEKLNNTTCIVKKGQVLRGVVSETECQQLQKDLNDLKGFKCVYHMKTSGFTRAVSPLRPKFFWKNQAGV